MKDVTIAQGGVVPRIHAVLCGPARRKAGAAAALSATANPSPLKAATKTAAKKLKTGASVGAAPFKGKPKKVCFFCYCVVLVNPHRKKSL